MMGLYIGRFQPFHNGHLEIIKKAMKEVEKLIIVVAVPLRNTAKDPFSAEERKKMIETALHGEGIKNFVVRVVNDIPSDEEYVGHVRQHVPPFNVVYVGESEINRKLFSKAGFKVVSSERYFGISSTKIRESMAKGDNEWKKMMPKAMAEYIEKNNLHKKL